MRSIDSNHYFRRAESFIRLAKIGLDPEIMEYRGFPADECKPGSGLLAVHAAIALCDGVLVQLGVGKSTAQDHAMASDRLQKACSANGIALDGIEHFRWLIGMKDYFAYGRQRVRPEDLDKAVLKVERMLIWAERHFPESDDD